MSLEEGLGGVHDGLGGDAILLVQDGSRGRSTELVNTDGNTVATEVLVPSLSGSSLNRHLGHARDQDRVLVRLLLLVEQLPAWEGHNADLLALTLEDLSGLNGKHEFGTSSEQDDVRGSDLSTVDGVGTLGDSVDGRGIHVGHALAREHEGGGALDALGVLGVGVEDSSLVGTSSLVTVSRADGKHVGHSTERSQVLDGLMGRSILSLQK